MEPDGLHPLSLGDPLATLSSWIDEARRAAAVDPEAMALATVGPDATPSVRIVLCRGIDAGGVVFFTNYASRKGRELAANPRASAVFHWPSLGRQVRVEGVVEKVSAAESDAYFQSRPRGSQLAACVSPQSEPIDDLAPLKERQHVLERDLAGREVPRPLHWGGYRLRTHAIELWIAGADRLHRRLRYERHLKAGQWGDWSRGQALAP